MTASGWLNPNANFFATGDNEKIVYTVSRNLDRVTRLLDGLATVVATAKAIELDDILADSAGRAVDRLTVEGGAQVHTRFLTVGLFDQLDLVVAPFFVSASAAPAFAGAGDYPFNHDHSLRLVETQQLDDVVLLRYLPHS